MSTYVTRHAALNAIACTCQTMCDVTSSNVLGRLAQCEHRSERQLSAILCVAWSRKTRMYWICCIAGALNLLSIHSPDYVVMVLVSIFMSKTHNHLSTISVL